jgi:methyl-accepting chemotaxis protein
MDISDLLDKRPWVRLLQILAGVLVAMMVAMIGLALVSERMMMHRLVQHEGEMLATAIQGAMSESLAVGDSEAVNQQLGTLKKRAPDIDVFVFGPQGQVSFATEAGAVGGGIERMTASGAVADAVNRALDDKQETDESFEERIDGAPYLTVVRPIRNSPRCHHCHGSSREVLGGIMVRGSTESASIAIRRARNINIAVGIIGLTVAIFLMRRLLVRVVSSLLEDVVSGGEVMAASSAELTSVFQQLSEDSASAAEFSESVAQSVNSANENLGSIAVSMEETSTAADSIAVSVEQMTASVGEIARESAQASEATADAVAESADALQLIENLSAEANEIGTVTKVISGISDQIDLLALNATIESARAGTAGRGFAVVADEIKKLARETSQATDIIRKSIAGIQSSTERIVGQVDGFNDVIETVNTRVTNIASAVEQQAAVTNEIAASVTSSSQGVRQATVDVSRISQGLNDISTDMSEMNSVAAAISDGSVKVSERAEELSRFATKMNQLIARFKI